MIRIIVRPLTAAASLLIVSLAFLFLLLLPSSLPAQTTPNLHLSIPSYQSNVNSWNLVVNGNFSAIDTWSATTVVNNIPTLQTLSGPIALTSLNATTGYQYQGGAPLNHCLVGNGAYYVDSAVCGGGGGGGATLQTNGTNNTSQSILNFTNPSSFNGLTFTFSNPSGGVETFAVGGTLANAGLANSSTTVNGQPCVLGSTCTVTSTLPNALTINSSGSGASSPATFDGSSAVTISYNTLGAAASNAATTVNGVSCALGGSCTEGVPTVGGNSGPLVLSFSTGAGSCSYAAGTTTCTITGTSTGTGTVTNFINGTWPSWLTPSVTLSTTTPTEAVTASAIPNSALAHSTTILGGTTLTLGSTQTSVAGLTVDGVTPTTMGYLDATSSIQTQLNAKQQTLTLTTTGTSGAATLSGGALNIPQYAGGSGGPTVQTNSVNNSSQALLNFETSTANSVGLTVTPSNPSGGIEKLEVTGGSYGGNAATASALASAPATCIANGQFAQGIAANGAASCDTKLDDGHTTANTLTYTGSGGLSLAGGSAIGGVSPKAGLFASLAACTTSTVGWAIITDSTTQTWGAVASGTGTPATPYTTVFCNGVTWDVMGK
jgi:hypothetical protein